MTSTLGSSVGDGFFPLFVPNQMTALELIIPTWVSAFWVLPLPGPYLTAEDERGKGGGQDGWPASLPRSRAEITDSEDDGT